jgi:two-component system, cell cycle sensor histidine kinase and response regulator CckA
VVSAEPETVLLVDDEESVRIVTARQLEGAGYRVLPAQDGVEALRLLDTTKWPVGVVITDLRMPRMDGIQLADRLRQRTPAPMVLFIFGASCNASNELPGPVLYKPFSTEELLSQTRTLLAQAGNSIPPSAQS